MMQHLCSLWSRVLEKAKSGSRHFRWRVVALYLAVFVRVAQADPGKEDVAYWQRKLWFPIGEGLEYRAYWGVIPVATSWVTNELVRVGKKTCLAIRIRTRSHAVLDNIYPVDDFLEAIVDLNTFLPIRFTKILNEGRYHTHEVTEFNHAKGKAVWQRIKDGKRVELPIDGETRDLISFMYSMRPKNVFQVGSDLKFRVMADEKVYDLMVRIDRVEPLRLSRYGVVDSLRIEPIAEFGGLFVRHKGRAWMWISLDPRRIVTKIAVRVPVAHVNIVLHAVYGPGNDFWVERGVAVAESAGEQET